jgi:hypothetical protein
MDEPAMSPRNKESLSSIGSPTRNNISTKTTMTFSNANSDEEAEGESSSHSIDRCIHGLKRSSCCSDDQSTVETVATTTKNTLTQDPYEVFRASLEFEESSSSLSLTRQREQNKKQSKLPPQTRNASTSSLYPSMECVSRADSDFGFEAAWHNADVSSKKNATTTITSSSTIKRMCMSRNEGPLDLHTNNSNWKSRSNNSSHLGTDASASRHSNALSEDELPEDASPTIVNGHQISVSSEANATTPTTVAASLGVAEAEAEAQVMIGEYNTIPPLEEGSVIQAELVYQGENDHAQDQQSLNVHTRYHEATLGTPYDDTGNFVSACRPSSNDEIATEATVIESGPLEKVTIAALSGHSTEVVVLQQESDANPFESVGDLNTKTSSLRTDNIVTIDTMSQRLCEQNQVNRGVNDAAGVDTNINMIATVVDCSVHPPEITNHSIQAELIGNSSTNVFVSDGVGMSSPSNDIVRSRAEINETERPTEATVLDSGPPDKATVDAWSTIPPEEAQVLRGRNVSDSVEDQDPKIPSCTIASVQDIAVSSDEQADIIEIGENFHPAEFESELGAATAQLSSCTIASVQDIAVSSDEQAEIVEISENCHPAEFESELEGATTAQLIGSGQNSVFPDASRIYEEDATVDVIVEEDTNHASWILTMESQSQILNEVSLQDTIPPATVISVENISSTASCDDQFYKYPQNQSSDAPTLPANDLDNVDGHIQSSRFESEVDGEYHSSTPMADECIEGPPVPQPRPFLSASTSSSTNNATSTGTTRSFDRNRSECTLPSVQTVSTSDAIRQSTIKSDAF